METGVARTAEPHSGAAVSQVGLGYSCINYQTWALICSKRRLIALCVVVIACSVTSWLADQEEAFKGVDSRSCWGLPIAAVARVGRCRPFGTCVMYHIHLPHLSQHYLSFQSP